MPNLLFGMRKSKKAWLFWHQLYQCNRPICTIGELMVDDMTSLTYVLGGQFDTVRFDPHVCESCAKVMHWTEEPNFLDFRSPLSPRNLLSCFVCPCVILLKSWYECLVFFHKNTRWLEKAIKVHFGSNNYAHKKRSQPHRWLTQVFYDFFFLKTIICCFGLEWFLSWLQTS